MISKERLAEPRKTNLDLDYLLDAIDALFRVAGAAKKIVMPLSDWKERRKLKIELFESLRPFQSEGQTTQALFREPGE